MKQPPAERRIERIKIFSAGLRKELEKEDYSEFEETLDCLEWEITKLKLFVKEEKSSSKGVI